MRRGIKSTPSILWVLLLALSASYSRDEMQIVDQDTSRQMDNKYIGEDIYEQFGIDPFTDPAYLGYYGKPYMQLEAVNDLVGTTLVGKDEFSSEVKMTKPYREDIRVNFTKEGKLMADFLEMAEGIPLFPNESCTFGGSVLKVGELGTTVKLTLKDVERLNSPSGYVVVVKLTVEESHGHLAIVRACSTYFVELNLFMCLNNIDSSDKKTGGRGLNKEVGSRSGIRPERLGSLSGGNFTADSWYTSDIHNYLTIILPEKQLLKGLKLDTNRSTSGSHMLKSCRVMVETPDGNRVNHGVFDRKVMGEIVYISFRKPVECTKVRLKNMTAFNGRFPVDVDEVTTLR